MLDIGEIGKFIVKRETDISYTLSPDDIDLTNYVFLHFNQATRKLNIGEPFYIMIKRKGYVQQWRNH